MDPQQRGQDDEPACQLRRTRGSWIASGVGLVLILVGVLRLTSATIGGPIHRFEERRTYDQVKRAAHEAYPLSLVIALMGLALMIVSARWRAPRT